MASTQELPVTPRRKRASSGADLWRQDAVIKLESFLEPQSTPDVHDIPELDWDDSPHPQDDSPKTPSPVNSPSKAPAADKDKEADSTPRRRLKASGTSLGPTQPRPKIDCTSESGAIDVKPAPLFHNLYPKVLTGKQEQSEILYELPNKYKSRDFTFSRWPRYSDQGPARSTLRFYMPTEERGPLQKRVKKESSVLEQSIQDATVTLVAPSVSVSTNVAGPRDSIRSNSSATTARFSRILPFNAIERLIEDSTRCVASLVKRPDERCSGRAKSFRNVQARLLAHLGELDDPITFIGTLKYLEEFIDTMTCTRYHHKIATEQLKRLYDRYHGYPSTNPHKEHDFKEIDIQALESWVQAWATSPDEGVIRPVSQAGKVGHSASIVSSSGLPGPAVRSTSEKVLQFPKPSAAFLKALQTVDTSKKTSEQEVPEANKQLQTTKPTDQINRKKPNELVAKLDMVIVTVHEIDISEDEQNSDTIENDNLVRYIETTQQHGVAQIYTPNVQSLEKGESSIVTDKSITIEPKEDVQDSRTSKSIRIDNNNNQPMHTTWKFDPTQVYDIKSSIAVFSEPTPKQSPRIQQRPSKPQVNLHQHFRWFHQHLNCSVQDSIYDRLHRPLTDREFDKGLIYMYWVTGSFGFVKIGKTSGKSTENRLNAWRRQCGHEIEEHTRGDEGSALELPHVYRIEALIHEELREARLREEGCQGCGVWHKEWFLVSSKHAQQVIQKWSVFILSRPYDRYGRLKESITKEKIHQLCQPISLSSFSKPPQRHSRQQSR
jgi:hypothetical protein